MIQVFLISRMYSCVFRWYGSENIYSNMDELEASDKQNNQATKEYMQFDSIKVKLKEQPKVSSVTYTYVEQLWSQNQASGPLSWWGRGCD